MWVSMSKERKSIFVLIKIETKIEYNKIFYRRTGAAFFFNDL